MFKWTDKSIELWKRAEKYTNHYKNLCKELIPYVDLNDEIYDIGCGLGFIDLELSPYVKSIRSFDIEKRVLEELDKSAKDKGIVNISTSSFNWTKEEGNCCDVLLACSFGNLVECFDDFIRMARDKVIIVKRHKPKMSNKYVKGKAAFSALASEQYLIERGISYKKISFQSEFGQPLDSYSEAMDFVKFHGMNRGVPEDEFLKENLLSGKKYGYKYYLPNKKDMVIFIITKESLSFEKRK